MSDDPLIDRLVAGLAPVRPRRAARDALVVGGICLLELALFLGMGGARPDMPMAMHQPSFWWKGSSVGLIALVSGTAALLSLDPAASPRPGLRWSLALALLCLVAGWGVDAGRPGWLPLAARLDWRHGMQCVEKMLLLAIPGALGLGVLGTRGAPTDRAGTAWAAGLAAAGWGAFVFVFACPSDDPLYIAVWYGVSCALVSLAARLLLPALMRW